MHYMQPMMRPPVTIGAPQTLLPGQMLRHGPQFGFAHNPGKCHLISHDIKVINEQNTDMPYLIVVMMMIIIFERFVLTFNRDASILLIKLQR